MENRSIRMTGPMLVLVLVLLLCCAPWGSCVGGIPGSANDGGTGGYDGNCHYDCFGGNFWCVDGEIVELVHNPVPCEHWEGSCPTWISHVCDRGCLYEGMTAYAIDHSSNDASFLCEGAPSAAPGDPCRTEGDCLPSQAEVTDDGTVINQYLTCDAQAEVCVETTPAEIYNYLGPCGDIPPLDASAVGYIDSTECSFCLVAHDPTAGCIWQGCTSYCFGDHECPPGSTCDKTLEDLSPSNYRPSSVCRPGPPGAFPQDLTCL